MSSTAAIPTGKCSRCGGQLYEHLAHQCRTAAFVSQAWTTSYTPAVAHICNCIGCCPACGTCRTWHGHTADYCAMVVRQAAERATFFATHLGRSPDTAADAASGIQAVPENQPAPAPTPEPPSEPDAASIAAFYRHTRDRWLAKFTAAENAGAEQNAEDAIDALDDLYAYFLGHGLIKRDSESSVGVPGDEAGQP